MLNKVQIIGRLGRDVELRQTPSGQSVASFTVATDESYTSRDGQKVEQTEWHRINIFGKQAELCGRFLGKGSLVYVDGRIRSRKWTDKEGIERTATEINADRVQFLDRKPQDAQQQQRQAQAQGYGEMQDIPF
jgi:single-strand DNA-binding protein